MVMWNPHSVMFEVAWCVMLYLTVLALEFSGMVFERLGWTRALAVQHAATVPLVIAGAVLSTLHQSSLGTFYLIVPGKLHPLWYTPFLPWMFYLSAIAGGLAMMIVESRLSSRAFGRGLEMPLLTSIGRALFVALGVYGAARLATSPCRGVLGQAFALGREAAFFQLELADRRYPSDGAAGVAGGAAQLRTALRCRAARGRGLRDEPPEREHHGARGRPGRTLRAGARGGCGHAHAAWRSGSRPSAWPCASCR